MEGLRFRGAGISSIPNHGTFLLRDHRTKQWIDGVSAMSVFHAFVGSLVGLLTFGIIAARQQQRLQPIVHDANLRGGVDWGPLAIVPLIPILAIVANVCVNLMAAGVWAAILIGATLRRTDWGELHRSLKEVCSCWRWYSAPRCCPWKNCPSPVRGARSCWG